MQKNNSISKYVGDVIMIPCKIDSVESYFENGESHIDTIATFCPDLMMKDMHKSIQIISNFNNSHSRIIIKEAFMNDVLIKTVVDTEKKNNDTTL